MIMIGSVIRVWISRRRRSKLMDRGVRAYKTYSTKCFYRYVLFSLSNTMSTLYTSSFFCPFLSFQKYGVSKQMRVEVQYFYS